MFVERDGANIAYEITGSGDVDIVMSHSLASSSVMWEPQMPALSAGHRVIRFDTRGHGASDAPAADYTLEQLADDAIAVIEQSARPPVIWIGLSMGGMLGQFVALKRPDLLRCLVLCDTSAQIPAAAGSAWDERINAVREGGMAALAEATMQRWFTPNYLREEPPAVLPIRAQIEATAVAGYIGCVQAIRQLDILERLPAIEIATLIIVGADDPGTPVAASEAIQARISGAELVVLENASHLSNVEQADAFTAAVLSFLSDIKQQNF